MVLPSSWEEHGVHYPEITGFRKFLRNLLFPLVVAGTDYVVRVQRGRTDLKTKFFKFASMSGNQNFFVSFFPIFFFCFDTNSLGRSILILAGFCVYINNWFKDYLCLPRPLPPCERLVHHGLFEFGMPSTHTTTAFSLSLYLLLALVPMHTTAFIYGLIACFLYTFLVSHSRIYLGMHTLADTFGGVIIGALLIYVWHFLGLSVVVEHWMTHNDYLYVSFVILATGVVLLLLHPEPVEFCPCFEDSACFVGSVCGTIIGCLFHEGHQYALVVTPLRAALRYIIALSIVLSTRAFMKPLMTWFLPKFFSVVSQILNPLSFVITKKTCVNVMDTPPSSCVDKQKKRSVFGVAAGVKFVCYTTMSVVGATIAPYVIDYLGVN